MRDEDAADSLRHPALSLRGSPEENQVDKVNILLVDDQPANLVALEAMLQGLGQNLI